MPAFLCGLTPAEPAARQDLKMRWIDVLLLISYQLSLLQRESLFDNVATQYATLIRLTLTPALWISEETIGGTKKLRDSDVTIHNQHVKATDYETWAPKTQKSTSMTKRQIPPEDHVLDYEETCNIFQG
jgi:hypothetical protein